MFGLTPLYDSKNIDPRPQTHELGRFNPIKLSSLPRHARQFRTSHAGNRNAPNTGMSRALNGFRLALAGSRRVLAARQNLISAGFAPSDPK
jgi:hypothetical protein